MRIVLILAVVTSVALGACRREVPYEPMNTYEHEDCCYKK